MSFFIYDKFSSFKTHFFYSSLAQHGPKWWILMKVFVFLGFWQDFMSSFTPFIIRHFTTGEKTRFDEIYMWSLHYTSCGEVDARRIWGTDFVILCLSMRLCLTTVIYLLTKYNFSQASRLPEWVSAWRNFIIFYAPAPLSYPIVISLAIAISSQWRENVESFAYLNILSGVVVWIANFFENIFYLPLYAASPIVGNGWFPCRMIPDYFYNSFEFLNQIILLMAITAPGKDVWYFYMAASALYNLHMFIGLWSHPFASFLESATLLSAILMKMLIPIACCIMIGMDRPRSEELWCFIAGWIAFALFTLIFYFVLKRRARFPEKVKNVMLKFQWTALGSKMDIRLCQELREALENDASEELMFAYIYARLIHGDVDRDMYQRICGLSWIHSHWLNEMIVFELCKAYCESPDPFAAMPEMKKMDADVAEYNRLSNLFWTEMLGGNIKLASATFATLLEQKEKLRYQFEFFRSFYPTSDRISTFITEFPHLAKNAPFHEQFKERYSRYGRQLIAERGGSSVEGTGFSDCTSHGSYMKTIVLNIRRRTKKAVPFCYKFYIVAAILLLALALLIAIYDYCRMFIASQQLNPIPGTLSPTLNILKLWGISQTTLLNAVQCTPWVTFTSDDIREALGINLDEPTGIRFETMSETLAQLSDTMGSIYLATLSVTGAVSRISSLEVRNLVNCWYDQNVYPWRYSNNTDLRNITMTPTSVIIDQTQSIEQSWDDCTDYCNCEGIASFKDNLKSFVAQSYDVLEALRDGCIRAVPWLEARAEAPIAKVTWTDKLKADMSLVVFWVIVTIMIWGCHIYHCRMLVRYFRPQNHPNPSMDVVRSEKTTTFTVQRQVVIYPLIILFLCFCYVLQDCIVWHTTQQCYHIMMDKYKMLADMGRELYAITGFLTLSLCKEMNLSIEEEVASAVWSDVLEATNLLTKSFASAKNSASLTAAISDRICSNGPEAYTFHDLFRCNPLVREVQHAGFLVWNIFQYYLDVDGNTPNNLIYLQHLHNTHLSAHISSAAQAMLKSLIEPGNCYYYFVVELIVAIFFGIFIGIVLWLYYHLAVAYYQQLRDIFVVLDPMFIASNKCLMNFIVRLEEEKSVVGKPSCLFEILEASNSAIMVLSDDLTIVALTRPVLAIFGYKQERLFGQFVDILIPKSLKETEKNDLNFYETLEQMKSGKITGSVMHWVVGRCSDDTVVYPRAKITRVDAFHTMFFVIEFKSASTEIHYENLALCYGEIFDNITRASLPVPVVPEIRLSSETAIKSFPMGVLLTLYMHDTDFAIDFYDDFDVWKATEAFNVQWLNGRDQAVVIDSSCGHCMILFLGDQVSDLPIVNALTYVYEFANSCGCHVFGAMVMCNDIELIVYHPDFVTDRHSKEISMGVEPISNRMKMLRAIAPLLVPSTLIVSGDIIDIADYIPVTPLMNNTGYDLYSLSIDINEIRSEVPPSY